MTYQINIYNLLIGFGMTQGFIFGIILFLKSSFKEHQKYLSLLILFFSFYLLWVLKYDYGLQDQFPNIQFLPILFLWGIGPAFYIYLKFLFDVKISNKKIKIHFFPLLIEFLYFNSFIVIHWLNSGGTQELNSFEQFWVYSLLPINHIIALISIGIYMIKSYRFLKIRHIFSTSNQIKNIFILFVTIWLIWVPYVLLDLIYYNFNYPPSKFYGFYILFTILLYFLGFSGFKINNTVIKNSKSKYLNEIEMKGLATEINTIFDKKKYYLDSNFNINELAKILNLHPNKVSLVINSEIKKSFSDFINSHRINEFKYRSVNYDFTKNTILGLAYECGFNSKPSFNRAFKKFNAMTPKEYINKIKT